MTTIRQAADQLAQALRDLYENGANCPDDKVLRARDAYDAAVAQLSDDGETQCVWDAPDTRVEELERTVAASQCLCGLLKTALAGAGMERSIERAERTAAELLKEKET